MAPASFGKQTSTRPPVVGSLGYLLLNLPLGVAGFAVLLVLTVAGVGMAIVWIGVPLVALAILLARGAGHLERVRIHALLGTYIPPAHRPLPPGGQKQRWKTRLTDSATWRDYTYFFLLLPLGIAEFVITVTAWSVSLALAGLPIYYRFLPEGAWYFPSYDAHLRWVTVDSVLAALPWAALGVLLLVLSARLTQGMASAHAWFARVVLGPSAARMREFDGAEPSVSSASAPVTE